MKISHTKVKFCAWIGTVVAQSGEAFVQLGYVVLEILEDAWNGALCVLWCQWLKADVLESDVRTLKGNFHVGDVILKVQRLWKENVCPCTSFSSFKLHLNTREKDLHRTGDYLVV